MGGGKLSYRSMVDHNGANDIEGKTLKLDMAK